MTSIIMVSDLINEERAKTLSYILKNAGIDHEVRLAQGAVIVEGNNDVIRSAKNLIAEHGFDVV